MKCVNNVLFEINLGSQCLWRLGLCYWSCIEPFHIFCCFLYFKISPRSFFTRRMLQRCVDVHKVPNQNWLNLSHPLPYNSFTVWSVSLWANTWIGSVLHLVLLPSQPDLVVKKRQYISWANIFHPILSFLLGFVTRHWRCNSVLLCNFTETRVSYVKAWWDVVGGGYWAMN